MVSNVAAIVAEAITDACRLGIGHAIRAIEDYAVQHPDSAHHCDQLIATLRHQSASLARGVPSE